MHMKLSGHLMRDHLFLTLHFARGVIPRGHLSMSLLHITLSPE